MEFEGKSDPEAETPLVSGVAEGTNENDTTDSSDNTIEPADESDDEAASSDNSVTITATPIKPGDYVQWESNGILKMPEAKRLSHFSDNGDFAFVAGSSTGIPVEELIGADLLPESEGESESALVAAATGVGISHVTKEADVAPNGHELPLDSPILSTIDHANGITRSPGNSVAEYIKDKQFSQAQIDRLIEKYKVGLDHHLLDYQWRCEVVYELHKETAKSGCKGMFSATLRRIQLADSTAYDMIARHKIRIGEMEDPDAPDTRDDEEQEEEEGESEEAKPESGVAKKEKKRTVGSGPRGKSPNVTLSLSGPMRKAVDALKIHFHQPNNKAVIQFCVLRVWREIETPLASRKDDSITQSRPRRALFLGDDDDLLEEAPAIGTAKSMASDYRLHQPSSQEAQNASGTA